MRTSGKNSRALPPLRVGWPGIILDSAITMCEIESDDNWGMLCITAGKINYPQGGKAVFLRQPELDWSSTKTVLLDLK